MNIDVLYRPFGALAKVGLDHGDALRVEPGAMVGMSPNLQMETGMTGGFFKGLKRAFGGENFFQNTFSASNGPGEILLGQSLPGDIFITEVPQHGLRMQSTAYIASHPGVQINTKVSGFKSFFAGEGIFTLEAQASGPGQPIVIGAYGGITEMQCDGSIVIDSGHLVAWDATLEYRSTKATDSGWIASFLSGEGIVVQFTGQGRIWMQSRNAVEYGRTIGPQLPPVG